MNRREGRQTKRLSIGLNDAEYTRLLESFAKTTCGTLSDYGRRMLLGDAVVIKFRNKSIDALTGELARIREELEDAGAGFSTAIAAAEMPRQPADRYIILHLEKEILLNKIQEIKACVEKIAGTCLQ